MSQRIFFIKFVKIIIKNNFLSLLILRMTKISLHILNSLYFLISLRIKNFHLYHFFFLVIPSL